MNGPTFFGALVGSCLVGFIKNGGLGDGGGALNATSSSRLEPRFLALTTGAGSPVVVKPKGGH